VDGSVYCSCTQQFCKYFDMPYTHKPMLIPKLKRHNIKQICAGTTHALFLQDDNIIWVAGSNENQAMGKNNLDIILRKITAKFDEEISTVRAGNIQTAFITVSGKLYIVGSNIYGTTGGIADSIVLARLPEPAFIVNVYCVKYGTIALSKDGIAYGTGLNSFDRMVCLNPLY
jgi:hypothetical protein